jgi:hypothetical protein
VAFLLNDWNEQENAMAMKLGRPVFGEAKKGKAVEMGPHNIPAGMNRKLMEQIFYTIGGDDNLVIGNEFKLLVPPIATLILFSTVTTIVSTGEYFIKFYTEVEVVFINTNYCSSFAFEINTTHLTDCSNSVTYFEFHTSYLN